MECKDKMYNFKKHKLEERKAIVDCEIMIRKYRKGRNRRRKEPEE